MFRLLVVALLLAAASGDMMRGVQILNHRAMCTKPDYTMIPLKYTDIWLSEGTYPQTDIVKWTTDTEGYVRDYRLEISGLAKFDGRHTHLSYHIHCPTYAPLCPGVAKACEEDRRHKDAKDYVVLPCIWYLTNPAQPWEKTLLNGQWQSIGHPAGKSAYSLVRGKLAPAPTTSMTIGGHVDRQVAILNHRMLCQKADGTRIPLAYQYIYLHEDSEELYAWKTDSEGYIRSPTSVHHNRAKWASGQTRLMYHVDCAKYGPICPGVANHCTDRGSRDPTEQYAVLNLIWNLPRSGAAELLNNGYGIVQLPNAAGKTYVAVGSFPAKKPKRSEGAMAKMLQ